MGNSILYIKNVHIVIYFLYPGFCDRVLKIVIKNVPGKCFIQDFTLK